MLVNYFKTALRTLWCYKSYTFINIISLAIAIAAMVWGYQDYRFAFSYDSFQKDIDNVYRGLTYRQGADGVNGIFPMPAVQSAKNDFAGITDMVRLHRSVINIKSGKDETFSELVSFTDPSFFNLFNFPLTAGSNNLNDPNAVLITENIASKYFGKGNAVGRTLLFYAGEKYSTPLTVKGVLKNPPLNSTIQFDIITNFDNLLQNGNKIAGNDWSLLLDAAFFKIPDPAKAVAIAQEMKQYIAVQNNARQDWKTSGFKFITLRENASLRDIIHSNYLYERPSDPAAYTAFTMSWLILLFACLNFSNTSVASSSRRLKEIGVRKVMGSTYRQLILQILLECALIVFAAILLSVLINKWWLPTFNKMFIYVDVQANYLHDLKLLLFIGVIFVFTTLLAGAYPAFYISRFNPTNIFRGGIKFGGSNLFSRIMLGLQITISLITVIGGIAFAQNAAFQNTYDFGFNIHNIIGVSVKDKNSFDALKNEIAKLPQVTALAGTKNHIGFNYRREVTDAEGIKKETAFLEVGNDYIPTMNLRMAAGRPFSKEMQSDYNNAILVTEKYAAMYGWKPQEALGKRVNVDTAAYSIVGILKDYQTSNLFMPAEPTVMKLTKEDNYQYLIIQAKQGDLTSVYSSTEATWKRLFPTQPFNGFYQDQMTAESYRVSASIARIFSWLAVVTTLLTATALFALISLTLLKRMKEIALRKIVGATPKDIFLLINKGYIWIVLAGTVIGCYAGWAMIRSLLNQIFKINAGIQTSTVVISISMMLLIAFVTTGIKIVQANRTRPVKLLRME